MPFASTVSRARSQQRAALVDGRPHSRSTPLPHPSKAWVSSNDAGCAPTHCAERCGQALFFTVAPATLLQRTL
jgi:hypothetical protein